MTLSMLMAEDNAVMRNKLASLRHVLPCLELEEVISAYEEINEINEIDSHDDGQMGIRVLFKGKAMASGKVVTNQHVEIVCG